MSSLQILEERLAHQMPTFAWSCHPVNAGSGSPDTEIPEEIQICATRDGIPVPGSPWRLKGYMLSRCGVDAAAKLICQEYAPTDPLGRRHINAVWDKLAET